PSGLQVEGGARFIPEAPPGKPLPIEELAQAPEASADPASHRKGGRPASPRSRLPDDVPLSQPNAKARRSIADGATPEEVERGPADDQLLALRDAERVLFPEDVRGIEPSWSFEIPEGKEEAGRSLGLPLLMEEGPTAP